MSNEEIASALEQLAREVEAAPVRLVGADVRVNATGGGSVTGLKIVAQSGPAGTHTTGMKIVVDPSEYATRSQELIRELRDAAAEARQNAPSKTLVRSVLSRLQALGNTALTGAISGAVNGTIGAWLSS